jgi:hypothetical protein
VTRPLFTTVTPLSGKALWKLDDPTVLRQEQAERARQAAEAAAKKLEGALDRKVIIIIFALPALDLR